MQNKNEELNSVFNRLMGDYKTLRLSLSDIYNQSQNIRVLSFNSAIEAARAGHAGSGFRIISEEIRNFSEKNDTGTRSCSVLVDNIERGMYDLIGIRTADVAFDTIDKIDRNLFERYCDVQAWASFGRIIDACLLGTTQAKRVAEEILEHMVTIYEVYHDALLVDMTGTVMCAATGKQYAGNNVSDRDWFKSVCSEKKAVYSDMYYSSSRKTCSVAYTSPVFAPDGSMVGVLSTRFNWQFILNIVDQAKVSGNGEIFVITNNGLVIGARNRSAILKQNMVDTEAYRQLTAGSRYGFYHTKTTGGNIVVYGFAHTNGYNAYPGKNWSVIIRESY